MLPLVEPQPGWALWRVLDCLLLLVPAAPRMAARPQIFCVSCNSWRRDAASFSDLPEWVPRGLLVRCRLGAASAPFRDRRPWHCFGRVAPEAGMAASCISDRRSSPHIQLLARHLWTANAATRDRRLWHCAGRFAPEAVVVGGRVGDRHSGSQIQAHGAIEPADCAGRRVGRRAASQSAWASPVHPSVG